MVDGQYPVESHNILRKAISGPIADKQLMEDIDVLIESGTDFKELLLAAVGKEMRQRIKTKK